MHRRSFLGLAAAAPLALTATSAVAGRAPVFAENGIAIRGADPVAYFRGKGAVAGLATERVGWRGAVWLFASRQNREAFERDPRRFAPRFGGYCAYTLSQEGRLVAIDPRAFALVEGRLYLIRSLDARMAWRTNVLYHINEAADRWPEALG